MVYGLNNVEVAPGANLISGSDITQSMEYSRRTLATGFLLIVLQALDGVLTSLGVSRFGVAAEGNPLLRSLMAEFGHIPILGVVKFLAIIFVIALCYYAQKLAWVQRAMGAISCVYIFAAIIPWTYILFIQQRF